MCQRKTKVDPSPTIESCAPAPLAKTTRLRSHCLAIVVLCALCAATYANTLRAPFVFDDEPNIVENALIRMTRIDVDRMLQAAFQSPNLRPVAFVTFALNYRWGRYDPTGYHAVNILVHGLNGLLVYAFLLQILRCAARQQAGPPCASEGTGKETLAAALAAAVFVVHPLQTQSVAYVVQRMNSLAALFYLAALLLYVCGRQRTGVPRWLAWGAAGTSWMLALGSKEIAITLPAAVLLYEWYFFRDLDRRWIRRGLAYGAAAAVVLLAVVLATRGATFLDYSHRDFTMGERLLTQWRVIVFYLSLALLPLPARLNLTHDFPVSTTLLAPPTTLFSLLLLVGIAAAAARFARRQRLYSFFVFWFFLHLAVESSVLPLEIVFEHRMYLPMVGLAGLFAVLLTSSLPVRWVYPAGTFLVAGLAFAAHQRNEAWRDPLTLWSDVVAKSPNDARAQMSLGSVLQERGDTEGALRRFREALRLDPGSAQVHYDLGIVLNKQGRTEEAIEHLRSALRLEPAFGRAHAALGAALASQGRLDEGIAHLSESVRVDPQRASNRHDLALALARRGRDTEAIAELAEAVRLDPESAAAHRAMGMVLSRQGRHADASRHLAEAVRIEPADAAAHNDLGIALANLGRLDEALKHFTEALRLDPERTEAAKNRDMALRFLGQPAGVPPAR